MANEITKPNDILIATLSNAEASTLDLVANDITFDNTQFLSQEEYKRTPFIQETFTKDGVFNEDAFNKIYSIASEKYQDLSAKRDYDSLEDFIEYDHYSAASSALGSQRKNRYVTYDRLINPLKQDIGIERFDKISDSEYSEKELAQQHKIWNPDTKQWEQDTPQSLNIFDKVFGRSLVYAKYEKTGEQLNPITDQMEYHEAGEWMTDENGELFTQYAPKDDVINTEVVALSDIISDEGSVWNSIDVFDSDDLNKSNWGIVMKNALKILPYFVPGLNTYWGAANMVFGTMAALPGLYKSLDALGSNGSSNAYREASGLDNWFKKFDSSMTDAGKSSLFTLESSLNMISDIWGQLYQQKAAAKLGTTLAKFGGYGDGLDVAKKAEKVSKLGQQFALGYMALTSTADIYNEALKAGYDQRVAAVTGLLSAGALFGIMNLNASTRGIGTWFLGKEDGVNTGIFGATKKVVSNMANDVQEAFKKGGLQDVKNIFSKRFLNYIDDLATNHKPFTNSMISEALEETSEEIVQDAVKGIIDGARSLGIIKQQGSFNLGDNLTSWDGVQRYIATALGGAVGGGMFHMQQNIISPKINKGWNKLFGTNFEVQSPSDRFDRYNLDLAILEGREEDLIREADRLKKYFPSTKFTGITDTDGNPIEYLGDQDLTYADVIVSEVKKRIRLEATRLRACLKDLDVSPDDWYNISDNLLKELQNKNILTENNTSLFVDYINRKTATLIGDLKEAKDNLANAESSNSESLDAAKTMYEQRRDLLKSRFSSKGYAEDLIEGYMMTDTVFASYLNPHLNDENFWATFFKEDTDFKADSWNDLSETQKNKIKQYREALLAFDNKNLDAMVAQLPIFRELYMKAQQKFSGFIEQFNAIENRQSLFKTIEKYIESIDAFKSDLAHYDPKEKVGMEQVTFFNHSLFNDYINNTDFNISELKNLYNIADPLLKMKVLSFQSKPSKEALSVLKALINFQAAKSGVHRWNLDNIKVLIKSVNESLQNSHNLFVQDALNKGLSNDDIVALQGTINEENALKFAQKYSDIKLQTLLSNNKGKKIPVITERERDYVLKQLASIFDLNSINYTDLLEWDVEDILEYLEGSELHDPVQQWWGNYITNSNNVVKDPFVSLFDNFHFNLSNGTDNLLFSLESLPHLIQSQLAQDNDLDTKIQDALETIRFMQTILLGMSPAVNGVMRSYLEMNPSDGYSLDDFAVISDSKDRAKMDAYFKDMHFKLSQFLQFSDEVKSSKSEEYKRTKQITIEQLKKAYEKIENANFQKIISKVKGDSEDDEISLFKYRKAIFNLSTENKEAIVEEIIEKTKQSPTDTGVSLIAGLNQDVPDFKIIAYDILASMSANIEDFVEKAELAYKNKGDFDPRYDQEIVMWQAFAWYQDVTKNKDNSLYKKYLKETAIKGDIKTFLGNALSIYGPAGTGKTTVANIIKYINGAGKVKVTAVEQAKVNDLKDSFDADGDVLEKIFRSNIITLINDTNRVIKEQTENALNNNSHENTITVQSGDLILRCNLQYINSGSSSTINGIYNIRITKIDNNTKTEVNITPEDISENYVDIGNKLLIFADEIQLLSPIHNYLLNALNVPFVRIGANDQLGYFIEADTKEGKHKISLGQDQYLSTVTPTLQGVYRFNNSFMRDACTLLAASINKKYDKVDLLSLDENVSIDNAILKQIYDNNSIIEFQWSLNTDGKEQFAGIRIDDTLDEGFVQKYLSKENTVVIAENPEEVPPSLKDYTVKTLQQALGSEWDNVIYYKPRTNNMLQFSATKHIYTALTRARNGVYIVKDDADDLLKNAGLKKSSVQKHNVGTLVASSEVIRNERFAQLNTIKSSLSEFNVAPLDVEEDDGAKVEDLYTEKNLDTLETKPSIDDTPSNQEEQREYQELSDNYGKLDPNWQRIQTFYIRWGKYGKKLFTNIQGKSLNQIKDYLDANKEYSNLKEDFGGFVNLVINTPEGVNLPYFDKVKSSPNDTNINWIAFYDNFRLTNFAKTGNKYYIYSKKYDEDEDGLVYKLNNRSPKDNGDDITFVQFAISGYYFTIGQLGYKEEQDDNIGKFKQQGAKVQFSPKKLEDKNIQKYEAANRKITNIDESSFYQVTGMRSFWMTTDQHVSPDNNILWVHKSRKINIEDYVKLGFEVTSITKDQYEKIREANSYMTGVDIQHPIQDTDSAFKISKWGHTTAIIVRKTKKNASFTKLGKQSIVNTFDLLHAIKFYTGSDVDLGTLNKNKTIENLQNTVNKLKQDEKSEEGKLINRILDGLVIDTKSGKNYINYNKKLDDIREFTELFNQQYPYWQFDSNKNSNNPVMTGAVIEPPTLLFVPEQTEKSKIGPIVEEVTKSKNLENIKEAADVIGLKLDDASGKYVLDGIDLVNVVMNQDHYKDLLDFLNNADHHGYIDANLLEELKNMC